MTVFALVVINKAGGLIYNRNFQEDGLIKLSTNDYLVFAGTFHGVHAITARLNPLKYLSPYAATSNATRPAGLVPPQHSSSGSTGAISTGPGSGTLRNRPEPASGLEVLETETFRMQCFTTMTGTKFLIFTEMGPPGGPGGVDKYLRKIYDLYSDYVMKNPFYSLEMPIRCETFDRKLGMYIREINSRS